MTLAAKSDERGLGLLSAAGVFCIWSGFLVFSRAGLQSNLTPFDLTALRFVVAGALMLPFALAWWPRHLPLHAILAMSLCGPGARLWLAMQQAYDLRKAEVELGAKVRAEVQSAA